VLEFGDRGTEPSGVRALLSVDVCDREFDEITDETSDAQRGRCLVNTPRDVDLLDTPRGHDRNPISKRQRFLLIMGHEHSRGADLSQ
jgi:hypothetical protein